MPPKEKAALGGAAHKTNLQKKSYQISLRKQGKTWVITVIVQPVRSGRGGNV